MQIKKISKKANSRLFSVIEKIRLPESKRSQHEIVGFVIIVIIVSVIGLILLSFGIGKDTPRQTSAEISHFLQSSMYHTSSCAINFIPQYKDVEDLIKLCYNGQRCLDGKDTCEVLNLTLKNLIESGFDIDSSGVNKAYKMKIYYVNSDSDSLDVDQVADDEILVLNGGVFEKCSSKLGASTPLASGFISGIIEVELEICKGE